LILFIVYFLILYKPFSLLYKLSGVMMTGLLLAGFGVAISGLIYTKKSECKNTALGATSNACAVIFFIVASLLLLFSHLIIFLHMRNEKNSKANEIAPDTTQQSLVRNMDTSQT
jgi:hypothetical protein